jgi:hypothetical protein
MLGISQRFPRHLARAGLPERPVLNASTFVGDSATIAPAIQAEIRHQPFQTAVLVPQLSQLSQLTDPQPRVLFLPGIVGAFADPNFPTNIRHLLAAFSLPQNRHDLLFRVSLLGHRPFSSPGLSCL